MNELLKDPWEPNAVRMRQVGTRLEVNGPAWIRTEGARSEKGKNCIEIIILNAPR